MELGTPGLPLVECRPLDKSEPNDSISLTQGPPDTKIPMRPVPWVGQELSLADMAIGTQPQSADAVGVRSMS